MIKTAATTDDLVKNISDVLSKKGIPPIQSSLSDWKIEDGMLFYQDRKSQNPEVNCKRHT